MAEFDEKLNAILGNPEVMKQIMDMAGAMNQSSSQQQSASDNTSQNNDQSFPFNPAAMQNMMEIIGKTQIDSKQKNLIHALEGYLPAERIHKLEKAMQAAKIAKYASAALEKKSTSGR